MHADYAFINGEVITVSPDDDVFQATAVRGNEICAVGTTEEVLNLSGPETQVVDLRGHSLLPGFIDSHLHMLLYGTNQLGVDCKNDVGDIEGIKARLAARARTTRAGEWVRGWGYNHQRLAEGRHPTRDDLDEVSEDHPVFVVRTCNHISVVNSRALELLGITRDTPDPEGGQIVRGEDGEPTQRTTLMHAIRSFTINGACASFEEDRKGSIAVGKLADLVVLNGSILSASPERILSMKPTLTMINGEIVYRDEDEGDPEVKSRLSSATSPAR